MRVICIRDNARPNEIPASKWVKKGEPYNVIEVMKCNVQGGLLGYKLAEIDLTGCEPYLYFAHDRFTVSVDSLIEREEESLAVA